MDKITYFDFKIGNKVVIEHFIKHTTILRDIIGITIQHDYAEIYLNGGLTVLWPRDYIRLATKADIVIYGQ